MGLFSNIFKKKPGGTVVGNIIRTVASAATGGILGSGAGMIPASQASANTPIAPQPAQIAQAPILQPILNSQPILQAQNATQGVIQTLGNAASEVAESATKTWLKKNWWMVAIAIGLPLGGFILLFMRTGKRRR